MDPAPQGTVIVASPPKGAGQRGGGMVREPFDFEEIVAYARQIIASRNWVECDNCPYDMVPVLRGRYPDCEFTTFATRLQLPLHEGGKARRVCTLYVRARGAGDDERATPADAAGA